MQYLSNLEWFLLSILLLLFLLASCRVRSRIQLSGVRYDYKVVDVVIMADPDNHEKQLQRWADEGWILVACIPLIGGASEGAPEVRYVLSMPWESRRVTRATRQEKKSKVRVQKSLT